MKLSALQTTIFASVVVHALIVAVYLRRASSVHAYTPRGVVDLELIEPVVHELDSPVQDEKGPGGDKNKKTVMNHPPVPSASPHAGSSNSKGPIGDPQSIARETDVFIQQVSRLIDQNKVYPKEALVREEEGKVVVAMTLDRDGLIKEAKVEQPCAFGQLNQAALQTVQKIGRFPPIPESIPVPLHLHVPILFRIER